MIFDGHTVRVRDLKGMHYLARLLADPGREFHVLDLVAAETGRVAHIDSSHAARLPQSALGDAGEMLDAQAKDAYRRRLAEIDDDIEQARAIGDGERAAQADAERDFLLRELVPRRGPGRAGSTSRVRVRARSSRCDPRHPPSDHPDRRPPPPTRRASRPHHPHRYLLRLHARPAHPRPLAVLTSTSSSGETGCHRGATPLRTSTTSNRSPSAKKSTARMLGMRPRSDAHASPRASSTSRALASAATAASVDRRRSSG